ncbi:sirohydrochlorin chelatase [Streptomyces scabiei]|uniref:sirohydrochlorin chelatase n=1 Tax=Streptomyces scabiei TaxID=1930 RepID=UPI0029B0F752|nr:sirohydrochlorin chelatase [Streptomyces scabiei]MDX3517996.1 sirohydrochlorin chelatase [Streptomyces scabiei]
MTTPPPALLVAGDDPRGEAGAEAFRGLLRELGRRHPGLSVGGGFAGTSRPSLGTAVDELVEQGVRRFAVVPLASERTARAVRDTAAALALARERHPGTAFTYGRPPGPHPALLDLLERRAEEALASAAPRTPGDRAGVTVLLVGHGSTDAGANAEVSRAARLLWEGRGYAGVETAFVSLAAPDVPGGLDRCVRLGARRVVVLPYVPLAGEPADRARMQTEGWAAAHPEIEVRSADVIGPEPDLLDLLVKRYREALEGDPHMNPAPREPSVHDAVPSGAGGTTGLPRQPRVQPDEDGHHGHDHHHRGHANSHAH